MTGGGGAAPGRVRRRARAVVLDIEGTVGALSHVRDVLFPYARERLARHVARQRGTDAHTALLRDVGAFADAPDLDETGAVALLLAWSDGDVKAPPLKALQALIWAEGYADGTLEGHVFPEVPGALERWRRAGIACHVYSSGARSAQYDWFAHSGRGDLTGLLSGCFDLTNGGDKRRQDSYLRIADTLGVPAGDIVFLSDVGAELDAAVLAGWQGVGVRRGGDPRGATVAGHPTVGTLDEVLLTAAAPPRTPARPPRTPPARVPAARHDGTEHT
ncbi:acireductone synthase [Streptomyces sp. NPDC050560]|uniref:acireductone synthase n=1 Tax=Streptomyces sp. NPDC050560 TaxID=3365630 RepID=UPI0037AED8D6